MSKISIKGVLLGIVVALAVDIASAIVIYAGFGGDPARPGMSAQEMSEARIAASRSTRVLLSSLVPGTLSTILGGYVAARVAKHNHYLNAAVIGAVGVVVGAATAESYPLWFNALAFLTVLPASVLGGHIARPRTNAAAE